MKREIVLLLFAFLSFFAFVSPSEAELDLEQEVLIIPDTHNEKPYIWNVSRNPRGYALSFEEGPVVAGREHIFSFSIQTDEGEEIRDLHVFVVDHDLHEFAHRRPAGPGPAYKFSFAPMQRGKYRFEIVFRTTKGWVNLRKDIKVSGEPGLIGSGKPAGEEDYGVKVKLVPKKAYAEHVATALFDFSYKGEPLGDIEKVDGLDMHVAAWDEDLKEFLYITPKQNLGGPKVAVSIVFMRTGKHAVFAEFKHKGVVRTIDLVLNVLAEPVQPGGDLFNLKPAETPFW